MPARPFRSADPSLRRLIPQESPVPVVEEPARRTDQPSARARPASQTSPVSLAPATGTVRLGSPAVGRTTVEQSRRTQ
jgi:hypothetical protein